MYHSVDRTDAGPQAYLRQVGRPRRASAAQPRQGARQFEHRAQPRRLLADTQRACDEAISDARKRADTIVLDAEKKAEEIAPDPELLDLQAQRDAVREEIDGLKKEMDAFRARMKSLLSNQSDLLETETF